MANVSIAAKGTAGWVPPGSIFLNHKSGSADTRASGRIVKEDALKMQLWYFVATGAVEVWKNPPAGLVAVAGHIDTSAATISFIPTINAGGQVAFGTTQAAEPMWLVTWSRGSCRPTVTTGNDLAPVSKGTARFISPSSGTVPIAPAAAFDDTMTYRRRLNRARHRVFFGSVAATNDLWIISSQVTPKAIFCAWQPNNVTDEGQPDTAALPSTVVSYTGGVNNEGWLHVWY